MPYNILDTSSGFSQNGPDEMKKRSEMRCGWVPLAPRECGVPPKVFASRHARENSLKAKTMKEIKL